MLKLIDDQQKSAWFFLTEPVQRFINGKLDVGDTVSIEVTDGEEEGSKLITKITSDKLTNSSAHTGTGYSKPSYNSNKSSYQKKSYVQPDSNKGYSKSPQEQEQIARLAIFHDAARLGSSLGIKDAEEAVKATAFIYNELYTIFKNSVSVQGTTVSEDVVA